jgi:AcrR family transcriptional regulator
VTVPEIDVSCDTGRDRVLDVALELFARKGIVATTISEIEAAAGLTRWDQRHDSFPDKVALLEAAVQRHVDELARMQVLLARVHFGEDTRAELTVLARFVLAEHDRQDVLLRIMLQEGAQYPELAGLIRTKIVEPGYRQAAEWIRARIEAGGFPDYDADAVAVVALGSLLAYAAQGKTFGGAPLGVETDRFVATWVEAWLRVAQTAEPERIPRV